MISIKDVQIQTTDKPQVIVSGLKNKRFLIWGDKQNTDNIFIGDQTVARYIASTQLAVGMVIPPLGSVNTVYTEVRDIFVDDSDKFYMVGVATDYLHVLICESETLIAAQNIISSLQIPSQDPITNRLDQIIALLSKSKV